MLLDQLKMFSRIAGRVVVFGLAVQLWVSPSLTFAEEEAAKAVESVAIGGGTSGGGDTPLPDLFTGAMSYQIPIEVPPGRNGMDPGLALTYSSRNSNGWVGMGWELEAGAIERSTRSGVDYTKDDYLLRRAGSASELVSVSTGEFRSKIESDFMRIQKQSNGSFVATNKSGIKFFFGQTENVIAQEIEKVLPEVVNTAPDGTKAVAYTEIIPVLIEAIKEQQKRIELLEKRLEGAGK